MYSKTKYDESGLRTTHLNYYDQYHHYYIHSFLLISLGTKTENKNHRTKEPIEFSNKIGVPHTAALPGRNFHANSHIVLLGSVSPEVV